MEPSCPRCGEPFPPVEAGSASPVRCAKCGPEPGAGGISTAGPPAGAGAPQAAPADRGAPAAGKPSPWSPAGIGRRISAAKLRWDAGALRRSLRSQLEGLGAAAARTPPPGIDLAGDLEELSRLDREAAEKDAAIESLKKAPGSGPTVRDARATLDGLRRRAREVRASIGQKVEAARPAIPGVSYAAIDFARAALRLKAEGLAALGEAVPEEGARRPVPVLPLAAAAVLGAIVILVALLVRGSPGDIPSWALGYVPAGTKVLGYVDLDRIRDSGVFKAVYAQLTRRGSLEQEAGIRLAEGDVSSIFLVGNEAGPAVVVRTTRDRSLDDIMVGGRTVDGSDARGEGEAGPEGGAPVEVRRGKGGYAAKTGDRTFCFADSREYLLQAARAGAGPAKDLEPGLREARAGVKGDIIVVIGNVSGDDPFLPASEGMIRLGLGLRVGSKVTLSGQIGFKTAAEASVFLKRFEEMFQEAEMRISSMPEGAREAMRKSVATIRALRLSQSGDTVRMEGSWPQDEAAGFLTGMAMVGPRALFGGY